MRKLILTTSFPAYKGHSQSPFIYNLFRHMNDIDVVCPYYKASKSKEDVMDGIRVHRFKQSICEGGGIPANLKKPFGKIKLMSFTLNMFLKSFKYAKKCDVIHCQWALSGTVGVILKKTFRKPLIITIRGSGLILAQKNKLFKIILKYTLKNADYVTALCEDYKNKIEALGVKAQVIENGVDDIFKPLGIGKEKIVLFVGHLTEGKGLLYLLEAIPRVVKEHEDIKFVFVGEGNIKSEGSHEHFTGPVDYREMPTWYNKATIFILPTLVDGRANVIAEAMACGLPVITTNIPSGREVIKDGENGLLIPARNSNAIAEKINYLLDNEKIRNRLGENARKWMERKNLTWEVSASKYETLYEKTQF